jgi:hypothetical protein
MITILTPKFIPFFMLVWIIGQFHICMHQHLLIYNYNAVNVTVASMPIEVLPILFRYGYATPFYNISHGIRSILFGTKNTRASHILILCKSEVFIWHVFLVGMNFGILIAWVTISCITLPLFQWYVRRKDIIADRAQVPQETDGGKERSSKQADVYE